MTPQEALRYLAFQAQRCRDRDSHEALCLLLPSIMRVCDLQPMTSFEALDFWVNLRDALKEDPKPRTHETKSGAMHAAKL